jgi:endonuclease III
VVEHFSPPARLPALLHTLEQFYGTLPSPPSDPFALFVWEVLSVHAMPRKRDAAFAALKRHRALTPDAMWRAPQKTLEESVQLAGPYLEQRLQALRTGVDHFRKNPGLPATIRGPMVQARRALKGLPQMGDGGAFRMLLFAADRPVLPVDAKVARAALRLGFGQRAQVFSRTARSIREQVAADLPDSVQVYRNAFLYLSHHGAVTCTEAQPHCRVCPVRNDCAAVQNEDFRLKNGL